MANSLNSSAEGPAFSDSDMSADECSSQTDKNTAARLRQENTVLKMELETCKLKCKSLMEENKALRQASVSIQAKAEQEEEFISNTLLKKIQTLKKEKETLAMNYEQEEEFLTNDLSRKLMQLRQEKIQLEQTLEQEQEFQVNKLMRKIDKLESEVMTKQGILEQLRREKIDLENALEQEQEMLVNRLWKRMDRLEAEKRLLQEKLEQPVSEPPSPRKFTEADDTVGDLSDYVKSLREEVRSLKMQLAKTEAQCNQRMAAITKEERLIKEENLRLQRKLMREMERREAMSRHLSESESSLEMDDERQFNEMASQGSPFRDRTSSSPIPYNVTTTRPISPGFGFTPPSPRLDRYSSTGSLPVGGSSPPSTMRQRTPQTSSGCSSAGASPTNPPRPSSGS